ncbi:MAG TPA: methyltransferase domain-containing protein [Polyangia bacterium]|nr:methyltransferase domain-containing protein [Polyangia bacterium]
MSKAHDETSRHSNGTPDADATPPPRAPVEDAAKRAVGAPVRRARVGAAIPRERSGPIGIASGDFATPTVRRRTTTQPRGTPAAGIPLSVPLPAPPEPEPDLAPADAAPAERLPPPLSEPLPPPLSEPLPPPIPDGAVGATPVDLVDGTSGQPYAPPSLDSPFGASVGGGQSDAEAAALAAEAAAVRALDSGPLTPPPEVVVPGPTPPPEPKPAPAAAAPAAAVPDDMQPTPPPEAVRPPPLPVAEPSVDGSADVAGALPVRPMGSDGSAASSDLANQIGSPTPTPAVAPTPAATVVAASAPEVGATPAPEVGATPAPEVGATPAPEVGLTPAPVTPSGAAAAPPVPGPTPPPLPASATAEADEELQGADALEVDDAAEGPPAADAASAPPRAPRPPPSTPPPIPGSYLKTPGPEVKPAPPKAILEEPHGPLLPALPILPEALSPRPRRPKRSKPWFEEVFDEDYLRTLPFMRADQTLREVEFISSALEAPPGSEILDVGCGYGRHAIELVQRGYNVTGLDLSLPLLIRAADEAQRRALSVNFVHADMREMAFEKQFEGAYSMLTSFGYFDEETNLRVAERIGRALKPGKRFLLDIVNRDYVVADLPVRVWWEGTGCVVLEEVDFNFHTSRINTHRSIVFEDGRQLEQELSVRAYSLHEIGRLLRQAGFRVVDVSGGLATRGDFFGSASRNLLIVAEKREDEG